ncbi:hypothetical protein GCM10029992_36490 [Glycomyces albus]
MTARTSWRPTLTEPDGQACVTVHHPCCPRTLSAGVKSTAAPLADELATWAAQQANRAMAAAVEDDEAEGQGMVCSCLDDLEPKAPVDIVYLFGDDLAESYLGLFRRLGFEVRITNDADDLTCDEDEPVPGHVLSEDVDLWLLAADRWTGQLMLDLNGHPHSVGNLDADTSHLITEQVGLLRR